MDKKNSIVMNHATKVLVARLENIQVKECIDCENGIDGIPNCKAGECDLPIELVNNEGRIGVIISNLENGKWDIAIVDKTFDMYYIFGFDADWNEILRLWKMPKKDILEHLEFHR